MKRRKHRNDQRHPRDKRRMERYPGILFQGWARPPSRELRKTLKRIDFDVSDGAMFKRINTWFEWN